MAPVTATTAGVARQIIDDPALIELIRRLSDFDTAASSTSPSSTLSAGGAIAIASKEDIAAEDDKDGDVVMADGNSPAKTAVPESGSSQEGAPEEGGAPTSNKPPLDIEGLVAELDKFPRWRFQEQVSFSLLLVYCYIRLNEGPHLDLVY